MKVSTTIRRQKPHLFQSTFEGTRHFYMIFKDSYRSNSATINFLPSGK